MDEQNAEGLGLKVYAPSPEEIARIENDFFFHPAKPGQAVKYEHVRQAHRELAEFLLNYCPPSRERSLALTKLEEAMFWANASIARNE